MLIDCPSKSWLVIGAIQEMEKEYLVTNELDFVGRIHHVVKETTFPQINPFILALCLRIQSTMNKGLDPFVNSAVCIGRCILVKFPQGPQIPPGAAFRHHSL